MTKMNMKNASSWAILKLTQLIYVGVLVPGHFHEGPRTGFQSQGLSWHLVSVVASLVSTLCTLGLLAPAGNFWKIVPSLSPTSLRSSWMTMCMTVSGVCRDHGLNAGHKTCATGTFVL